MRRGGERASRDAALCPPRPPVRLRPDVNDVALANFRCNKAGRCSARFMQKLYKNIHHSPALQPTRLRHFPCSSARRPRYSFRTFTAQELLCLPVTESTSSAPAHCSIASAVHSPKPCRFPRAVRGSVRAPAVRRAVALDAGLVDTVLAIREGSARRDVHRRRWPSLRGLLPRRHRRDVRPCAGTVARALVQQATRGYTTMLPSEDAAWVSRELARRFKLPVWQFALSASDANRFVLRWARGHRPQHDRGVQRLLSRHGRRRVRRSRRWPPRAARQPARAVVRPAREHARRRIQRPRRARSGAERRRCRLRARRRDDEHRDGAARSGLLGGGPENDAPPWHAARSTRRTRSAAARGGAVAHDLEPDMLVVGKPIAGGVPCAVWSSAPNWRNARSRRNSNAPPGHSGIGTTLREHARDAVMRRDARRSRDRRGLCAYVRTRRAAGDGLEQAIAKHELPWCVTRIGARTEFQFASRRRATARSPARSSTANSSTSCSTC